MKSFCAVLFCLLAVDQILGHSIQPRLIGTDVEDTNDKEKNVVAFMNSDNKILCTGSFIHSSWIITSAWCAKKIDFNTRYLLSAKIADNYAGGAILYNIKAHEQYNPVTMINDIALVQVAVPAPLTVQLNTIPRTNKVLTELNLQIRGLGLVANDGAQATKLREATVQIRDNKVYCAKYGPMPANTICSRLSVACMGDSGGPLLEKGNTIWGIISVNEDNAEMCDKSIFHPSPRVLYTLLFPYRAWIQKTTGINL